MASMSDRKSELLQIVQLAGQPFVIMPLGEYERICGAAGEAVRLVDHELPAYPKPDRNGNFPAKEYLRVSMAREIIRRRKQLQLPQTELAKRAGLRPETLSRIESGQHTASHRSIDRLNGVLHMAELATKKKRASR